MLGQWLPGQWTSETGGSSHSEDSVQSPSGRVSRGRRGPVDDLLGLSHLSPAQSTGSSLASTTKPHTFYC